MKAQDREQQQLIGYWAKTQGFSLKALERTDLSTLQALRLASNCLKQRQFLNQHDITTFATYINNFRTGKTINKAHTAGVFRKARRLQRSQAKTTRKATR